MEIGSFFFLFFLSYEFVFRNLHFHFYKVTKFYLKSYEKWQIKKKKLKKKKLILIFCGRVSMYQYQFNDVHRVSDDHFLIR